MSATPIRFETTSPSTRPELVRISERSMLRRENRSIRIPHGRVDNPKTPRIQESTCLDRYSSQTRDNEHAVAAFRFFVEETRNQYGAPSAIIEGHDETWMIPMTQQPFNGFPILLSEKKGSTRRTDVMIEGSYGWVIDAQRAADGSFAFLRRLAPQTADQGRTAPAYSNEVVYETGTYSPQAGQVTSLSRFSRHDIARATRQPDIQVIDMVVSEEPGIMHVLTSQEEIVTLTY